MKHYRLIKGNNLIATLFIGDLCKEDGDETFPVVNEWVKNSTNGECYLERTQTGYDLYAQKNTNFKVHNSGTTLYVYKSEYCITEA